MESFTSRIHKWSQMAWDAEYCDQFVCLFVCLCVCLSVREHISGTAGSIFIKFVVQTFYARGLVYFWRRCDMYFRFMDDVTLTVGGRMAMRGRLAALRYRSGVWCLWIPCFVFELVFYGRAYDMPCKRDGRSRLTEDIWQQLATNCSVKYRGISVHSDFLL